MRRLRVPSERPSALRSCMRARGLRSLLVRLFVVVLAVRLLRATAKVMLHESPYFLPGVSNLSFAFPTDEWQGTVYRVFGTAAAGGVRQLTWYEAEKACADVGLGLAAVTNGKRKEALDAAILASETVALLSKDQPFFWIGGYRTSLSDSNCTSGDVKVWPYFNESAPDPAKTFNFCGKDPVHDWAWSRPSAQGSFDDDDKQFIYWRDLEYDALWWLNQWLNKGAVDDDKPFDPQPSGWVGEFNTRGWPFGGNYENCTCAEIPYPRDNPDNILGNATWYHDWGCAGSQPRWVCEMADVKQAVDEEALAERPLGATVATSPFYVAGVSDTVYKLNDRTYYRMFGVAPDRTALFKSNSAALISWDEARQACYAAGAETLAVASDEAASKKLTEVITEASKSFLKTWGVAETVFSVWLGGGTEKAATSATAKLTHNDFLWYSGRDESGTPAGTHSRWAPGFPKAGLAHVASSDDRAVTSCIASAWDAYAKRDRWQNVLCDDPSVRYFICSFTDPTIGTVDATLVDPLSDPNKPESEDTKGGKERSSNLGVIVGGAAAAAALSVVAALAGVFVARRRRQRRRDEPQTYFNPDFALPTEATDADAVPKPHDGTPRARPHNPALKLQSDHTAGSTGSAASHPRPGSAYANSPYANSPYANSALTGAINNRYVTMTSVSTFTSQGAFSQGSLPWQAASGIDGSTSTQETNPVEVSTPISFLNAQLDGLIAAGGLFARKYILGDHSDRRQGGQGVVQFCRKRYDGLEYAIKFFLSMHAFEAEKALYETPAVQRILPHVEDMADPEAPDRDHLGRPLPPYIVMERGEALDEWSMRAEPDLPTTVTVLSHLASRLADLHKAGMVHRDLKPGNVMWLPRENRWTILDFGCVAIIGSDAPIAYSLSYAPPEVIAAADAMHAGKGPHTMLVTPALDAWSIGVMIFRMLTTDRGENMRARKHMITIEQLRGEEPLPWEGSNLTQDKKRRLGVLKESILKLLSRDPALRPSMSALKVECNGIFAGKTTVVSATDDSAVSMP